MKLCFLPLVLQTLFARISCAEFMEQTGNQVIFRAAGTGKVTLDDDRLNVSICFKDLYRPQGLVAKLCYGGPKKHQETYCGSGYCQVFARITDNKIFAGANDNNDYVIEMNNDLCAVFDVYPEKIEINGGNKILVSYCTRTLEEGNRMEVKIEVDQGSFAEYLKAITMTNVHFKDDKTGLIVGIIFLVLIVCGVVGVVVWWFKFKKPQMIKAGTQLSFWNYMKNQVFIILHRTGIRKMQPGDDDAEKAAGGKTQKDKKSKNIEEEETTMKKTEDQTDGRSTPLKTARSKSRYEEADKSDAVPEPAGTPSQKEPQYMTRPRRIY